MDLGGTWLAAKAEGPLRRDFARPDLDDASWEPVAVPEALARSDGPVLYRRRFEARISGEDRRAFLVMEGVFSQCDVWLDGSYLGDAEGYFFPHSFEVTTALRERSEHLLAVEVSPGGIWAPVRLKVTGPVRLERLRLACVEASAQRAVLELWAVLDSALAMGVGLVTEVRRQGHLAAEATRQLHLARGANRARWRVEVPAPELWWPAGHGAQPLYDVVVRVQAGGQDADSAALRTGLREVRARAMVFQVNGERLFLMGADLPQAGAELAREAGLNFARVKGHVARPGFYDWADETGLLLWQDLPGRQQALQAVWLLAHRPSICLWCAAPAGVLAGAALARAVQRADSSRPALARPAPYAYQRLWRSALGQPGPASVAGRLALVGVLWPAALRFCTGLEASGRPGNLKAAVEGLRRLQFRPAGGLTVSEQGSAGGAFAPLLAMASWPLASYRAGAVASFALHVVNGLARDATDLVLEVRLSWPGGGKLWRFAGSAPPSSCCFVGKVAASLPSKLGGAGPWPLHLELVLQRGGEVVSRNCYEAELR